MTPDEASAIATDAVIWLAGEPEALAGFLAASGLAPGEVARRGADPEFLAAVLDWVLGSDRAVLAFTAATGRRPEDPARARALIAGGPPPDWT
jgi:hypothetical protein